MNTIEAIDLAHERMLRDYRTGDASGIAAQVLATYEADRPLVTSPESAVDVIAPHLAGADRERCVVAHLDTKHRVIAVSLASVGTVDHTFMNPREILRDALLANASAIVVAHNHPSGDSHPSPDDHAVTRRLGEAARAIGIDVLDHVVIGDGGTFTSLARLGILE